VIVRRGVGAGVLGLPWQCWVPGYAMVNPDFCNVYGNPAASLPSAAAITAATVPRPPLGDVTGQATFIVNEQGTVPDVVAATQRAIAAAQAGGTYDTSGGVPGATDFLAQLWDKYGGVVLFGLGFVALLALMPAGGRR
jgi:hypothetical protein